MTRADETIRAGDRVRYRDINLPDTGTVEHIEPPFARVRWSRWPSLGDPRMVDPGGILMTRPDPLPCVLAFLTGAIVDA